MIRLGTLLIVSNAKSILIAKETVRFPDMISIISFDVSFVIVSVDYTTSYTRFGGESENLVPRG